MASITNAGIKGYDKLHFEWFLVDWCNYACSYCNAAEMMTEKFSKETSPSKFKLVLQKLQRLDMNFEMDLFGGEPTLHPEFLYILEQLNAMSHCQLIEIKTNLSKPLHFLQEIVKFNLVKLSASYHAEYYNQTFLDKCVALRNANFYVHINLSDNPEHWPQILEMIDYFDQHSVRYDLNILQSTPGHTVRYEQIFFDIFGNRLKNISDKQTYRIQFDNGTEQHLSAFDIFKNKMDRYHNYKCQARLYEITSNGDIVNSCTRKLMPLIIKQEHIAEPVSCPRMSCHADMMFNFYKEKNVQDIKPKTI
jgi:organic radical activating enzyme